jgi:hypothetical protein
VKEEDGIQFATHGEAYRTITGQPTRHIITAFGLMNSNGTFIDLELIDHSFTDTIKTKLFGDIIRWDQNDIESYWATEDQIKQIHHFLSGQH